MNETDPESAVGQASSDPASDSIVAESEPTVDPAVVEATGSAVPLDREPPPWRIRHRTTFRLIIGVVVIWLFVAAYLMLFKHV